jgi:hypothetical protein
MVWSIDFQEQYVMSTPVVFFEIADTAAGPMTMTATMASAIAATRAPSRALAVAVVAAAAAAILTMTPI